MYFAFFVEYLYLLNFRFIWQSLSLVRKNRYTLIVFLFVLSSFLSLFALDFTVLKNELQAFSLNAEGLFSLFNAGEQRLFYSLNHAFLSLASLFIAQAYFKRNNLDLFVKSMFLALVITIFLGLFDYYGFIALDAFRPLDPVVNPRGQFRLQSFFAHSGWLAEYLTFSAGFSLLFLKSKLSRIWQISLVVLFLVVTEFCLILTYQRGGWLSYPVTLLSFWFSALIILNKNSQHNVWQVFKKSFLKVLLFLPLTVVASMFLLHIFTDSASEIISHYTNRFTELKNVHDRTDFIQSGILLGSLNPFIGLGTESFAFNYEAEFLDPTQNFYHRFMLPLHGSAHSFYAQVFSGQGMLGLLPLFLIFIFGLFYLFKFIFSDALNTQKINAVMIFSSFFAMAVYALVQEITYILSLKFLMLMVFVAVSCFVPEEKFKEKRLLFPFAFIFLAGLFWKAFLIPEKEHTLIPSGCYITDIKKPLEKLWCLPVSVHNLEVSSGNVSLQLEHMPISGSNLRIIHLGSSKEYDFALRQGENNISFVCKECENTGSEKFKLVTDNAFVPAYHISQSRDYRYLGLMFSRK